MKTTSPGMLCYHKTVIPSAYRGKGWRGKEKNGRHPTNTSTVEVVGIVPTKATHQTTSIIREEKLTSNSVGYLHHGTQPLHSIGEAHMMIGDFAEQVHILLTIFPGSVTSGFRSQKRNQDVGGGESSWHLAGLAADIVLDNMSEPSRIKCVQRAKRMNLDAFDEGDHIHIEVNN